MKTLILSVLLSSCTFAQNLTTKDLVGVWQKGDSLIAATYLNTYQFFSDGSFIYHFSGFDNIGRIKSLHGKYRLSNNTLYTKIDYRIERINGFVRRGFLADEPEWVLDSTKSAIVKQSKSKEESYTVKVSKDGWLLLDSYRFWKISSDPKNYRP